MKYAFLIAALAISPCAFAQAGGGATVQASQVPVPGPGSGQVTVQAFGQAFGKPFAPPVQGEPYSATVTNEFVQTLADGNRIVQTNTGTIARDSLGRTRQDAPLPKLGNLSVENAPHIVFIEDPVAQVSYTLNVTDKVAQKLTMPTGARAGIQIPDNGGNAVFIERRGSVSTDGPLPPPFPMAAIALQDGITTNEQAQVTTEDLGSQTMQGVLVNGVRTTRTIPAAQIGNDKPISIVTEVWTAPELNTIVYSKRDDPRMGEQTFQLTNISRTEPDPSLFAVPSDFKIVDGPQPIIYRQNQ